MDYPSRETGPRVQSKDTLNQSAEETDIDDPTAVLRAAIEPEIANLKRGVETYVWKFGLAERSTDVSDVAEEVLHEAIARAFARADSYDRSRVAHAWIIGIAVNIIRERLRSDKRERRYRAEPSRESEQEGDADSGDALDQIPDLASLEEVRLRELLDLVEPTDRGLLRMAYVDGLKGRELASKLEITEGAARVRLSRALRRLGNAYRRAQQTGHEGR